MTGLLFTAEWACFICPRGATQNGEHKPHAHPTILSGVFLHLRSIMSKAI